MEGNAVTGVPFGPFDRDLPGRSVPGTGDVAEDFIELEFHLLFFSLSVEFRHELAGVVDDGHPCSA